MKYKRCHGKCPRLRETFEPDKTVPLMPGAPCALMAFSLPALGWRGRLSLPLRRLQRRELLHQPGVVRGDLFLEHVVEAQRRSEVEQVVLPPVPGPGWVASGCEGRGAGRKLEHDEQAARASGIGNEGDVDAATAGPATQKRTSSPNTRRNAVSVLELHRSTDQHLCGRVLGAVALTWRLSESYVW